MDVRSAKQRDGHPHSLFQWMKRVRYIIARMTASSFLWCSSALCPSSGPIRIHRGVFPESGGVGVTLRGTTCNGVHNNNTNNNYKNGHSCEYRDSSLFMWRPPDDGNKGYYNMNERGDFDPDKLRWGRRRGRKNRRLRLPWSSYTVGSWWIPHDLSEVTLQRLLVYMNVVLFLYQIGSAAWNAPQFKRALLHSGYTGPSMSWLQIVQRNLIGGSSIIVRSTAAAASSPILRYPRLRHVWRALILASSTGPLTLDLIHDGMYSFSQPYRLLTAGFLHGSVLHILFNMQYLWTVPWWLEDGFGWPLYLTTYLASIVSGNFAHSLSSNAYYNAISCIGASGGICGLNGLLFVMLRRMNRRRQINAVLKNMLLLFVVGLLDNHISNASHIGGFACGVILAMMFGPRFRSSYTAKIKMWFFDNDSHPRIQNLMGPNVTEVQSRLPLRYLWSGLVLWFLYNPSMGMIPLCIAKALWRLGSLTATTLGLTR